jgi:hypothetical protein
MEIIKDSNGNDLIYRQLITDLANLVRQYQPEPTPAPTPSPHHYSYGDAWQFSHRDKPNDWINCCNEESQFYRPYFAASYNWRLHPHNELVKAYSNDAIIEYFNDYEGKWEVAQYPAWNPEIQYRVQPVSTTLPIYYEYAALTDNDTWVLSAILLTEEEAQSYFSGYQEYTKTGRSWQFKR